MVSALDMAGIRKTQTELVRQFIDGLREQDYFITLLTRECKDINTCYSLITLIRGAKTVGYEYDAEVGPAQRKNKKDRKRFNRLEGKAKAAAKKDGNCLECGKKGHWWRNCPDLKPKAYCLNKKRNFSSKATAGSKKKVHQMKGKEESSQDEEDEELQHAATKTPSRYAS